MIGRRLLLGAARKGGLAEAAGLPKAAPRLPAKAAGRPEAAGRAEAATRGSKAPRALLAVALLVHGGGVPRLRSAGAGEAIKAGHGARHLAASPATPSPRARVAGKCS